MKTWMSNIVWHDEEFNLMAKAEKELTQQYEDNRQMILQKFDNDLDEFLPECIRDFEFAYARLDLKLGYQRPYLTNNVPGVTDVIELSSRKTATTKQMQTTLRLRTQLSNIAFQDNAKSLDENHISTMVSELDSTKTIISWVNTPNYKKTLDLLEKTASELTDLMMNYHAAQSQLPSMTDYLTSRFLHDLQIGWDVSPILYKTFKPFDVKPMDKAVIVEISSSRLGIERTDHQNRPKDQKRIRINIPTGTDRSEFFENLKKEVFESWEVKNNVQ